MRLLLRKQNFGLNMFQCLDLSDIRRRRGEWVTARSVVPAAALRAKGSALGPSELLRAGDGERAPTIASPSAPEGPSMLPAGARFLGCRRVVLVVRPRERARSGCANDRARGNCFNPRTSDGSRPGRGGGEARGHS